MSKNPKAPNWEYVSQLTNAEYEELEKSYKQEFVTAEAKIKKALQRARQKGCLKKVMRRLIKTNLWFLMTRCLNMKFIYKTEKPYWIYQRCKEVEMEPDGHLDIWAREHYKSTIVTFALTIQEILKNPEITIGIFSFKNSIAKQFLLQIKYELETNGKLKKLFPDVLWKDPKKQSKKLGFKWSEDIGITVKRKGNPKECTVESWGLTDGQPTSKHYDLRIYDDVITKESVTNPEMIKKVTDYWLLSLNLGKDGGRERYIGTFYHYADTYSTMIESEAVKLRKYPCFHNGQEDGVRVLQSEEYIVKKKKAGKTSVSKVFSAQMLCDPKENSTMGFKKEWLKFWPAQKWNNMNILLFIDPASKKKKKSDYTTFWVIGLGADLNFYNIDIVRDKLSLTERSKVLFSLHRKYRPKGVYYEEYALQADIEHHEFRMEQQNYRFHITPVGGKLSKEDRILTLEPQFRDGRIYLMERCVRTNYEGEQEDLVQAFIKDEYLDFPFCDHDDMLDSLARINSPEVELIWPEEINFGDTLLPDNFGQDEDILRRGL